MVGNLHAKQSNCMDLTAYFLTLKYFENYIILYNLNRFKFLLPAGPRKMFAAAFMDSAGVVPIVNFKNPPIFVVERFWRQSYKRNFAL